MNDCSKIKCPLNALTFKDCNLTEKECCYFTKQPTNGDVIKAMFPNIDIKPFYTNEPILVIDVGISEDCAIRCEENWWNAPYKGGDNV